MGKQLQAVMAAAVRRSRLSCSLPLFFVRPFSSLEDYIDRLFLVLLGGAQLRKPSPIHKRSCPSARLFSFGSVDRSEPLHRGARLLTTSGSPSLVDLMALTLPHTWYPNARKKKWQVAMHVGPTNSGKTYNAIQRLQLCSSGVYCGPLRLLAWEVAERVNKADVPCNLVTGQERREVDGAKHTAMTVEMADLTRDYGCAVVDEIQMIGCQERVFSFTRALLGLAADELHLCGDPSAISVVQELLAATNDSFQVFCCLGHIPQARLVRPNNLRLGDVSSMASLRTGNQGTLQDEINEARLYFGGTSV